MEFRRLTDSDLPLLHRWLNEPGVVRWWEGDDVSWGTVVREYGQDNTYPIDHWVGLVDGVEVGWIQCYASAAFPEEDEVREWRQLGVPDTAAGIDYLIGDPRRRGSGVGSQMIRSFVDQVVFGEHPEWTMACASPYAANVASCRALRKAGFVHHGTFIDDDGPCDLMVRHRDDQPDPGFAR